MKCEVTESNPKQEIIKGYTDTQILRYTLRKDIQDHLQSQNLELRLNMNLKTHSKEGAETICQFRTII